MPSLPMTMRAAVKLPSRAAMAPTVPRMRVGVVCALAVAADTA